MGTSIQMLEKTYVHGNYRQYGVNLISKQPEKADSEPMGESLPASLPYVANFTGVTTTPSIVPKKALAES